MPDAGRRILTWTVAVGAVSFAIGFFGPILLVPDANQGPLLGIFITGPLGAVGGLLTGLVRERFGWRATPADMIRSRGITMTHVLRTAAGIGGSVLILRGLRDLPASGERGAAAAIVVGTMLIWYAAAGRVPAWFRR